MKPEKARPPFQGSSYQRLRNFNPFLDAFQYFIRLPLFLVPWPRPKNWITLALSPSPFNMAEIERGLLGSGPRDKYDLAHMGKAAAGGAVVKGQRGLFADVFAPVLRGGTCESLLVSGPFAHRALSRTDLEDCWGRWSGSRADPLDPHFQRFVWTALETPLLEGDALRDFLRFFGAAARILGGDGSRADLSEVDRIGRETMSRHFPHAYWAQAALDWSESGFCSRRYWTKGLLDDWEKKALGLDRAPTVAAVLAASHPEDRDLVDYWIRNKRLFWECFREARRSHEGLAHPMREEGTMFLTSAKSGARAPEARREVRDRLLALTQKLERALGGRVRAGVGPFLKAGTPLRPSVEGALRALRWTSYLDSQVLFMDEIQAEVPVPPKDVTDWALGSRLLDSITQGVLAALAADREAYIQRILDREGRQLDLVRLHFTQWINRAVEALQQRPRVAGTDPAKRMAPHLGKIQSALMTADLIMCFKAATEELFELAARPAEGMGRMELREMLQRMREHPESSWSFKRSASEMKWSAPTFSRRFRKETGNSFGVFLRRCRLDKAKKLLALGGLSITRISEESGFATPAYFAAAFRRAYGKPPRTFLGKSSEPKNSG